MNGVLVSRVIGRFGFDGRLRLRVRVHDMTSLIALNAIVQPGTTMLVVPRSASRYGATY